MSTAREVVPGFKANPVARIRRGSVDELPLATRWTAPLRDFGEEKAPAGRVLQPFGYRRNGGRTVHTGADVGALMDGAGLYACAAGIVRFVYTGSDMGTLVVVEHRRSETEIVNVLYMHAADVVHVAAGDRVEPGQLIASIGTGFSFENGGHYAHLHLGAYPGRFDPAHNYGYKPAADGLDDWHDPIAVLRRWIGE
jgi:murein DD-endopeptidase MepM/ murein hydrolase activator NlpD